jgi:hypothetical protein
VNELAKVGEISSLGFENNSNLFECD